MRAGSFGTERLEVIAHDLTERALRARSRCWMGIASELKASRTRTSWLGSFAAQREPRVAKHTEHFAP